jgi:cold shock CspA family protein/ribosome-associated translation inhibitor RaiA
MDSDLEIAWHQISPVPEYEQMIRERVGKLERMYPRIVSCRVSVELVHRQHVKGNFPEVHIVLQVPGEEIAVSRELHRMNERRPPNEVATAIRQAFRAAEQRLKDFKRRQYGEVKPETVALVGHILQLEAEENYGFISVPDGGTLYFHRDSVADDGFGRLPNGERVEYEPKMSD